SRPARIINTASAAHQDATLDFDDLQSARNYRALKAYSRAKLCNILFTRELARRLRGTAGHRKLPASRLVATRFGAQSRGPIAHLPWVGRGYDHGAILLRVSPDHAVVGGTRRSICFLAAERSATLAGMKENGSPPL